MSMPRYAFVMLPVLCGLFACKHETSPFCPQGMSPVAARSVVGKSLWCESQDKLRAQWVEWHAGGTQLRQSCGYRSGKPEGSFTAWHPSGKPWVHGQFTGGAKFGKWKQWDGLGSLVAEGDYSGGRLVAGAPVAGMADCEKMVKP
jgi:hypothetical protein